MHGEHFAAIEVDKNVFGASIEALHPASGQSLHEVLRQREAQIFAALLDFQEPPPRQHWDKSTANGLDFWKLRHF
jgi:hypothetical protein